MPPASSNSSTSPDSLLPQHREHLHLSGLTDETIAAADIASVTDPAVAATNLHWSGSDGPAPAIAYPIIGFDGSTVQVVLRPDSPRTREDGSVAKYEQPVGERHRVWFPPPALVEHSRLIDLAQPLIFTEGIKKALAAIQAGAVAVSMQGVSTWHDAAHRKAHKGEPGEWELHPDLEPLPLKGRRVYIAFDGGDTSENPPVILAEGRLARLLLDAGADVRLLRPPFEAGGPKVGLDDFLAGVAQ
jgi:putative DNA primase/helicase